jgi:O-methyltransferase involved in polyketide biosynthesis
MASATAAGVAVARGAHRSYDQPPWVLDDPFALRLVGPQWAAIQAASVLSYDASDAFLDDAAREMVKIEARLVAAAGEPYATRMSPAQAEALIAGAGLEVAEHLTPQVLEDRYFAGRSDGLRPSAAERLIADRARRR